MHSAQKQQFAETLAYIQKQTQLKPRVGIILGTGLGRLAEEIVAEKLLPYNFIPHFPLSTVESHFGKLILGHLDGVPVVAMQGRMHYYEGYSMSQITYPVRIMKLLGVQFLLISNAAGGLNPGFRKGDLVAITDHINLQPENPLRGPNEDDLGPRFPDMSQPYDTQLCQAANDLAQQMNLSLKTGVYAAVAGPNLETRAEYRFLRTIGADLVGMSTVPEVIVAQHMSLRTFAISVVTDECIPETLAPVSVGDIIAVARQAEPALTQLLRLLVARCVA